MEKFKLYQIRLTDSEIDLINKEGHEAVHKNSLRLSMNFSKDISSISADAFNRGYYTHVSNITTEGLEGVFQVGNIGPEEQIERLAPMHSVSVGDIVEGEDGVKHVVADFGFKKVDEIKVLA